MSIKYDCKTCNYSTDRKSNWNRHLNSKLHLNGRKNYNCEKCNIDFTQKSHLDKHLLSNKHNNYKPIIDRRKLNQTKAYIIRYKCSIITKKIQLKKQPHRVDELLDEIDVKIDQYNNAKARYIIQKKENFNKIINYYCDPCWRLINSWYLNTQLITN